MAASQEDDQLFVSPHIVQVLSIKLLPQQSKPQSVDRYRIIISDGLHFIQAMIATQLNGLIASEEFTRFSTIKITRLTANMVQGKKLHIILGCEVVEKIVNDKIGDPQALKVDGETPTPGQGASMPASNYQSPAAPQQQQQAPRQNFGGSSSGQQQQPSHQGNIFAIEGLSPYQNNWTIKARASNKSDVRHWTNARGEGKLFSVNFMDESGEIKATGFNACVDEFYDRIQDGKVYLISKGRVNLAKKKFSNVQNDYEIALERNTEIIECPDGGGVPSIKYKFVEISALHEQAKDSIVDVIGVLKDIGPVSTITTRADQKELIKREVTLVDHSSFSIRLTLWGKQAENFNYSDGCVVAFKGLKVGDYGGRNLSFTFSSMMSTPNPDLSEAYALRGWYDALSSSTSFQTHSSSGGGGGAGGSIDFKRDEIRSLHDVRESQVGTNNQEFFATRATIMHIRSENIAYPGCRSDGCSKKVIDTGNGGWRCEKCDKTFESPEYRYIFSMAVADWSGQLWLQGFNEVGLAVFGCPADEAIAAKERDESAYNAIMHKAATETYNFTCKAKMETFNDQTRIRYTIVRIAPLNHHDEACAMRDLLKESAWSR